MEFAIQHAREIVKKVQPRLMYQYKQGNWPEKIAKDLLALVNQRDNEVIDPIKRRAEGYKYKLELAKKELSNKIDKPSGSFVSRVKYLLKGKL